MAYGMGGYSVGDFGEDPEDGQPDVQTISSAEHTARKRHGCEACEGWIEPGQRYQKDVWKEDGELVIHKHHADPDVCRQMALAVEQWRAELQEQADREFFL